MINKIMPSLDQFNIELKSFDSDTFELTNHNSIKVSKVFKPTN